MDCSGIERPVVSKVTSFRDGPKDQTRNLEIPGSRFARPGMTSFDRSDVTFTTGAKNLKLARQSSAYWEMIPADVSLGAFCSN
jgi:hypothetical protein